MLWPLRRSSPFPTRSPVFPRAAAHTQVRQIVLPYGDAEGPCKARALAQTLWSGEEYVLQIDSHMR